MADEAKRRGRPPKAEGEKKNVNFTFRARPHLRERLMDSAAKSDRSLSEEIERRLEESYGGAFTTDYRTRTLLEHMVQLIDRMEKAAGKKWWEDEVTASICGDSIRGLINIVMPERERSENELLKLIESEPARAAREAREAVWKSTLRLDAMDRAIEIFRGEPGSPDYIKADDKLSQLKKTSSTK